MTCPSAAPFSRSTVAASVIFLSATCHSGPHFTDGQIHDVGLGSTRDRYKGYNTPSLRGVYQKVKLLHDGRADSLRDVLTGPHAPENVAGSGQLTDDEVTDLLAYLKSL